MSATGDRDYRFQDGEAYERYMGAWSRRACAQFLPWLEAPPRRKWLDLGCGTGVLTEAILSTQQPDSVAAIDPAAAQVGVARARVASALVRFEVADACALPLPDESLDIVASALVVNFIPDAAKAVREMARVLPAGGQVGAFVWDFAQNRSPSGAVRAAVAAVGAEVPGVPGTNLSAIDALRSLFASAGFVDVATRTIDVTMEFAQAEDYWIAQATGFSPAAATVKRLADEQRERAKALCIERLERSPAGAVRYTARANALKARKR